MAEDSGSASAQSSGVFANSASIKQAVALLNGLNVARLPALISRIANKVHVKDEKAFSPEEQTQLAVALELSAKDVTLLLDTLEYLLATAAYHQLSLKNLGRQLALIGVGEEQAQAFAKVWSTSGPDIVAQLKEGAFYSTRLQQLNWQVNVRIADDGHARAARPSALLELDIAEGHNSERIAIEFTHDELMAFYNKLETIQSQLDRMS